MASNTKSTKVVTGEVRLSYVNLLEPRSYNDGQEPKYSVMMLIPKSDRKTVTRIKSAQDAAIADGVSRRWGGKRPSNLRLPMKDGDSGDFDGPEYEGHYVLRASSKRKPGLVDAALDPVVDEGRVYSGCYGRVSFDLYPYSVTGNNGISAGLDNVQITRDGEPLGSYTRPEDDFGVFESDGADDGLLG